MGDCYEWCATGVCAWATALCTYINDLPELIANKCLLYADDSKIIGIIRDVNSRLELQKDLYAVTEWTRDWLMRLNTNKCKVMHFGKKVSEGDYHYELQDVDTGNILRVEESKCERDLGVNISSDLKWKTHVGIIAAKANRILGMLKRTFRSRDSVLWKKLFISLVRPHLEYASTVWNPYQAGDVDVLERVQRRATKIPTSLSNLEYEDRLREWNLTSLAERRKRGDLIQMYKVKNGLERIDWVEGPIWARQTSSRNTSRNCHRLERELYPSKVYNDFRHFVTVRQEFFLNRVCEPWNRLTNSQIAVGSLESFKAEVDNFMAKAAIALRAQ